MDFVARLTVLLFVGAIVWSLWRAGQGRCVFVVRITGGNPRPVTGTVTAAFLDVVREVAAEHGVKTGEVRGLARGTRLRLEFSRHFPEPARQRLRNWWGFSDWKAGW